MYQQINNIVERVAKSASQVLFATDSAKKSISRLRENPRTINWDEASVLSDLDKAEELINEIEARILSWLKRNKLNGILGNR